MKVAVKIGLVVAAIVGMCVIAAVIIIGRAGSDGRAEIALDVRPEVLIVEGGSWPMFRGGQRLLGRASGALADSLVFFWKFKTNGEVRSSPVIEDCVVYVGSSDANVYAIDLKTGQQVWAYQTGDAVEATPCVVGGSVFVGSSDGLLYALDAKDGSLKWKYETEAEILGAANWMRSPDSERILILVGSYDNKLYCMDSADGELVWMYETDYYINGSPAIDEGKTVFGGCDALIHVVSVADGSKLTQIDAHSYIAASAALLEGQVYVGNYDNAFIKADIAAGKIMWEYTEGNCPFFSSPAVGESVVVFGGRDNRVHCVNRDDGAVVWTFSTQGEVDSSPVICGDKVVVGSEDGRLYMVRLSAGTEVWSYEIGQAVMSSPAVAHGLVVVGCDDGYVYAFGATRQNQGADL